MSFSMTDLRPSVGATSVPSLTEFNPRVIPFQLNVIRDLRTRYDYTLGVHQILLSGAVGSAKTILMAHLIITHCLNNPGALVGIGRLTMPHLKETLLDVILKHLSDSVPYKQNQTKGTITFPNRSKILCFSWKDRNYKKVRSYEFTLFAIEELTENDTPDAFLEILPRLGRVRHVKECILIAATNPDDPTHWAYEHFIMGTLKNEMIHVYYSKTKDNPFLPESYISFLESNLDAKMARRMLEGEWLSISQDVVYYNYDQERNYKRVPYEIDPKLPIHLSFDFNVALNKPMSAVAYQIDLKGVLHIYAEFVIEGARTETLLEDAQAQGFFDHPTLYLVHGDATGKARNAASKYSNYDIISQFLSNHRNPKGESIRWRMEVPTINPPIRTRHIQMNAAMKNTRGEVKLLVYSSCPVSDKGLRLTKLKVGGAYIEDDSKPYQHITTAIGYGLCWHLGVGSRKLQGTVAL